MRLSMSRCCSIIGGTTILLRCCCVVEMRMTLNDGNLPYGMVRHAMHDGATDSPPHDKRKKCKADR